MWQGHRENGTIKHCCWECKLVQSLWKTIWRHLKNLLIVLQYYPAIPLLGIYLKEYVRLLQRHLHTHVYCSTIHNSQAMETVKMPHYW
jgi:hypothetical protein